MKNVTVFSILFTLVLFSACTLQDNGEEYTCETLTDANGFQYESIKNDPAGLRLYTLDNGLKVYLATNQDEPRVQTYIVVKAGSTYDPKETTGLAHYLEHMMFKGTDEIATTDWESESALLDEISGLYEAHKATDDPAEKKEIYQEIDRISGDAAKIAVANEYDKLVSALGAKGTNANTSHERTIYTNNIPSNQLERWLKLESERFSQLVLRLFHTEIEAVYEEFNMYQDNDYFKAYNALNAAVFKKHPYGTQTVIGKAEHLKNPSMVNIYSYFDTYYRANNMAICMSGDLDFEQTIQWIDTYFGDFEANPDIPAREVFVEDPLSKPEVSELYGPDQEFLQLAYRFDGYGSEQRKFVTMIDMILNNSVAGLIDLNLVQSQKVLRAGCRPNFNIDYGTHIFNGNPRGNQTLEEVKDLILAEVEKVKNGEFDEWLLQAIINDFRLSSIREMEGNRKAHSFVNEFFLGGDWIDHLTFIDDLEKITKQELVDFANLHYKDNYVVLYKRTGKDENVVKVDKPKINPIEVNREAESKFYTAFMAETPPDLKPVFVDFEDAIASSTLDSGIDLDSIKNPINDLFSLNYIIEMGKDHSKELKLAVGYLPYLGTDVYSPSELQEEWYKLGISMNVYAGGDRSYVYISGLEKSLKEGMELLEHVLANVIADQTAYDDYVDGIIKKRSNAKLSKGAIMWGGLMNYGKFGPTSSFTDILSEEQLRNMNPNDLTGIIKEIYAYEHRAFYYGKMATADVGKIIDTAHHIESGLKPIPEPTEYAELDSNNNKVFFVNYDMVQSNIMMISKDVLFDKELLPEATLFGEYFGSGLSSIVFQEIRESKALAYSAFASYARPNRWDRSFYSYAYVGTQADKLKIATDAMLELMNDMPRAEKQFNSAKNAIMKKIESERIIKSYIYWTYLNNQELKIDYDYRKDIYEYAKNVSIDQFEQFFNEHIKDKNYTFLVIGNRDLLDKEVLKQLGEVQELTLEEVFNY